MINYYCRTYAAPNIHRYKSHNIARRPMRSKDELKRLKARTRCLRCGKKGHWRAECKEAGLSMSDATQSRIRKIPSTELNETLFISSNDEDEYASYVLDLEALSDTDENDDEVIGASF